MKAYFFILILLFHFAVNAQNPNFRFVTYGLQDGLSQSMVKRIAQDHKGFMWFATQDGLNRFDGHRFKIYSKGPLPNGLPWGNIEGMIVDSSENVLWLATAEKGIAAFNCETELFKKVPAPGLEPLPSETVNGICQTPNYIWACTKNGLGVINKNTGTLNANMLLGKNIVTAFTYSSTQVIAFSYEGDAWLIDAQKFNLVDSIHHSAVFQDQYNFEVFTAYKGKSNEIWINTRKGIYKASSWISYKKNGLINEQLLTTNGRNLTREVIYTSYIDSQNNFWVGVDSIGLLFRPPGKKAFYHYKKNPSNRFGVDDYFWQIFESRNGIIWIGTDNGVSRQIAKPKFIKTLGEETDLPQNRLYRIFSICAVNDSVLLYGRRGDAFAYDFKNDVFKPIINVIGHEYRRVYIIKPFKPNMFFAGTSNGIYIIERKGSEFIIRSPDEFGELKAIAKQNINAITAIDEHNYLIGGISGTGLWWWNKQEKSMEKFSHNPGDPNSLVDDQVTCIYRSYTGNYWIGTQHGLSSFNPATKRFRNYFDSQTRDSSYYIYDVIENGQEVWMAFYHDGLARWNPEKGRMKLFSKKNGLVNTSIYNIRKDNIGNIWFGTNSGLTAFNLETEKAINYTINDGIQGNEFNGYAVYETDQHIYFGGINGINIIDKNAQNILMKPPSVAITSIEYIQGNIYKPYVNTGNKVTLKHRNNDIILNFTSLDFSTNHRTQYAYKLQGYDKDWITHASNNEVAYTNLDPGHYTFMVKAINPEFIGEPQITSLPITIVPAWYQTLTFKIFLIASLVCLFYLLIRAYYQTQLRRQRYEYEKKIAIQDERQRISSEIHDDIGAGLSGVRLLTELTKQKTESPELRKEVDRIYNSVTDLSGKMREVIWSLNTDNDSLENLLYYIRRQAELLFENSAVKLVISLPENIPAKSFEGDKRRHIYLAVKEALHNCIKHSKASLCKLTIKTSPHSLQISVKDNGTGYNETRPMSGNGIRNMAKRMKEVHGQVKTETFPGTNIEFFIPLNQQI